MKYAVIQVDLNNQFSPISLWLPPCYVLRTTYSACSEYNLLIVAIYTQWQPRILVEDCSAIRDLSCPEQFNMGGWTGCDGLEQGDLLCVSAGDPPMPAALPRATGGPQAPGAARPSNYVSLVFIERMSSRSADHRVSRVIRYLKSTITSGL
ncbi:Peptidoglycan-binding Lysin subgroup [Penicillium chermesinum]|uniref:Peptidoglycan-binding Lysin subgroup n=1 Tax=Penicillium chermesinum TaxID=63820 RepID=A0A9W9TJS3_9EURO|nr:Peptidoglycan-binding Lysin subgroup [Penicillium chermesinum]KAJ5225139.1 Peptidoglycan-binding Lysin subgroup [Penicillium chermesinum]